MATAAAAAAAPSASSALFADSKAATQSSLAELRRKADALDRQGMGGGALFGVHAGVAVSAACAPRAASLADSTAVSYADQVALRSDHRACPCAHLLVVRRC